MLTLNMKRGAVLAAKRGAVLAAKRGAVIAAIAGALTFNAASTFAQQAVQPVAPAATSPATSVTIKDVKVGSPVFGSDGAKIGAINKISADANGQISEIYVAPGGVTGLGVPVIQVLASQIVSAGPNVKLSVSAEEAKKFPTGSNNSG